MASTRSIIIVALLLGVCIWVLDAALSALYFSDLGFLDSLILKVPAHEIYVRTVMLASFVVLGVVAAGLISHRKRAEKLLALKEEQWRTTLKSIGDAVITTDKDGRITFMNSQAETLTKWSAAEAIGVHLDDVFRIVNEQTGRRVPSPVDIVLGEGKVVGLANHTELIAKDGTRRPIDDSGAPICGVDGEVAGVVLVFHDITERRQMERDLIRRTRELETMADNAPDIIVRYDRIFRHLFANRRVETDLGIPRENWIGRTDRELGFPPELCDRWEAKMEKVFETGEAEEIEFDYPAETGLRHYQSLVVPEYTGEGEIQSLVVISRDITARKTAESALRAERNRAQSYFDIAGVMLVVLNRDGVVTSINRKGCEVLGWKEEEIVGRNWFETCIPEKRRADVLAAFERIMAGEIEPLEYFENPVVTRDGEERIIAWHNAVLRDAEGNITTTLSSGADITDRVTATAALHEEKERLAVTLASIGDAVIATDRRGDVTLLNAVAEQLTGWSSDEALGKPLSQIFNVVNELTGEACDSPVERVLATGNIVGLANHTALIARDGQKRAVADSAAPIRSHDGEVIGVVLVFRDITESRRLEEMAQRGQRLETAGTIAGQVAHDFNNLLAPLMSYPELIRDELDADHPALKFVDQIEQAAEQMADINQQLLTLGRRGHYRLTTVNLNDVVKQAVEGVASSDGRIRVELSLDDGLMNIRAGSAQIHRAVLNLVTNAMDAMSDGGCLRMKTENYYVDSPQGMYARVPRGEYAKLTISDTGDGIPTDLLPKVFDPFFTTKQTDKTRGSGLGLSVVHAVVEDHNGFVDYESETGKGTTFYLYFPITRDAAGCDEPTTLAGGGEKVLVVDDDQMQREVTSRLLAKLGYTVTVVESGEKAVDIIRRERFELVVLDMVMPPGIDGAETYKRALALQPDLRAVIISGYADASRVEEAQGLGAGQFVRKPLTLKSIAVAVRQELDRRV